MVMIGIICGRPPSLLLSARDHLIHYKYLHRILLTLVRISRIYLSQSSGCWHCSSLNANFIHIFWECAATQQYWLEIVHCIQPSIETCLLSLMDSLSPPIPKKCYTHLTYFDKVWGGYVNSVSTVSDMLYLMVSACMGTALPVEPISWSSGSLIWATFPEVTMLYSSLWVH